MKKVFLILNLFYFVANFAQENKKTINSQRVENPPKIDGILDDNAWQGIDVAKDFVMYDPGDGTKEPENKKTTVKIVYDDQAIYFGATMYDDKPEDIAMQFGSRDVFGQSDFFIISINPNNDGQNDTVFAVMSTGMQADSKVTDKGDDFSWNAVWESKAVVNADGWVVEIKIPYSALRFSNSSIQTWGINFSRKIINLNEEYVWNYIDKKTGKYTQYSGNLEGIENIQPPTRLNFSPYASTSYTTYDGDSYFEKNIGMDLKYGINESFTLDATLIPDFGQTAFDDQVLNLGPFEERYEEKRAFFTEGTELFSKGNLFYSRRIGNAPVTYNEIEENLTSNEEIIENPSKVNMINAFKLSGRTKGGLGIGLFNAITEKTYAKIKDLTTDEIKSIVTEPLANYNVLVLDQQFNKNSSISLVNTNVLRNGEFRDANTTALLFDVSDKGNKYNVYGNIKTTNITEDGTKTTGYAGFLKLSKIYGNFQYDAGHWRADKNYDIKDLGFQRTNNYANYFGSVSYQIFEPTKHFNKIKIELEASAKYLNNPSTYTENEIQLNGLFVTPTKFAFGVNLETNIGTQFDYYEPRVEGRFFKQKGILVGGGFISTDYRKKLALDVRLTLAKRYEDEGRYYELSLSPRFRFSDKFQIIHNFEISNLTNENGYVTELDSGEIIFGNRDLKTITNSLSGSLSFNTKSSLALIFRHYWSPVKYDSNYYELNNEGTLDASSYDENNDINYNIWNLDLSYSWEFAPGSQLVALYRNSIFNEDNFSQLSFSENLDNLFQEPKTSNVSLKLIYYLDYNKVKTWL